MLILVGVTVTVAINGGLFGKAREGAKGTEIAREKEELEIAVASAYDVATGKINKEELQKALGTGWIVEEEEGTYTVTSPNSNVYIVEKDGTIEEKKAISGETKIADIYCTKENCTEATHLHKGDYVEYISKTEKTTYELDNEEIGKYTGYTTELGATEGQSVSYEKLNWRILGKNEKGEILLISGAPTTTGIGLFGYVGYNNFEDILNHACDALYSNTELGAIATSITMNDISTYLGGEKPSKKENPLEEEYGYKATFSSKFDYDKENNKLTEKEVELELEDNSYTYEITKDLIGAKNREILCGDNINTDLYRYFIASTGCVVWSDSAAWSLYEIFAGNLTLPDPMCVSDGEQNGNFSFIRPVVTLPSSTTIEQVSKKTETIIEKWKDPLN